VVSRFISDGAGGGTSVGAVGSADAGGDVSTGGGDGAGGGTSGIAAGGGSAGAAGGAGSAAFAAAENHNVLAIDSARAHRGLSRPVMKARVLFTRC
jgi:hypothetical protein